MSDDIIQNEQEQSKQSEQDLEKAPSRYYQHKNLGKFAFKEGVPKAYDQMKIGVRKTQLLEGQSGVDQVDRMSHNIAIMLSTLEWAIEECPKGFRLGEVESYTDLFELYMAYMDYQYSFRKLVRQNAQEKGAKI